MQKTMTSLCFSALVLSLSVMWAAEAQQMGSKTPKTAPATAGRSAQTGVGVGINTPLSNTDPLANPGQGPLLVVATCNATSAPKDLEGWVGQNSPTTVQDMIASLSGTGRQSITFVVPWGWYYYINVAQQPGGGIPPGGVCKATTWWLQ